MMGDAADDLMEMEEQHTEDLRQLQAKCRENNCRNTQPAMADFPYYLKCTECGAKTS